MGDDAVTRLRAAGLRVTPQRRAILDALEGAASVHPSAEEVFRRARADLPELSRATVYNALNELVRVGLVQAVEGLGPVRFDSNLDRRHHHFHCRRCGGLFDVDARGADRLAAAPGPGFVVERTRIVLEGVCPECRRTTSGRE